MAAQPCESILSDTGKPRLKTLTPASLRWLHIAATSARETHHGRYDMSPDLIGWATSAILLLTLCRQIHTQAKDESARGVSHWLFAGQIAASAGFIAYSWLLHNWLPQNGCSSSPTARSW